ncbi:MAG: hypothetical protein M0P13_03125 [Fibrobacteraceae bacterium]|nr:hypothetical protein [Fibrobacteraceae bacterium]
MNRIENARVLFFDEMPIRRILEFHSDYYPVMLRILDVAYERNIQMVASPVTLSDICFQAFAKGSPVLAREYKEFFTRSSRFSLREVDAEISVQAAEFRARSKMSFEESIQLATAYVCGADMVLTENESWKDASDLNIVLLREFI